MKKQPTTPQSDLQLVCVQHDQVCTDSLVVANSFGKEHKNVLQSIDNLIRDLRALKFQGTSEEQKTNGLKFQRVETPSLNALKSQGVKKEPTLFDFDTEEDEQTEAETPYFQRSWYVDVKGERRRKFLMTRDGFMLLVMGFNGKKALAWKQRFIQAFNKMEHTLLQIMQERKDRRDLTDAIRDSGEDKRMHGHAYSQYTDLIYKRVIGLTAKQFRYAQRLSESDNLKLHLDEEKVRQIAKLEKNVQHFIDFGLTYNDIKTLIANAKQIR